MKKYFIITLLVLSLVSDRVISKKISFFEIPLTNRENPVIIMETSMGIIYIELFKNRAPKTVENFIALALGEKEFTDITVEKKIKRKFYNGLSFFRVVPNFIIQTGCLVGDGSSNPGYTFEDEINADSLGLNEITVDDAPFLKGFKERFPELFEKYKDKSIKELYEMQGYKYIPSVESVKNSKGTLAMANSGPDSNGSQFFINIADNPELDGKHTVFGQVVKGLKCIDRISSVKTDFLNNPSQIILIKDIVLYKMETEKRKRRRR